MIRILIADDHPIVRKGIREILEHEMPGLVWGEASHEQQVLQQVEAQHWDLVILDVTMPGPSGVEILGKLQHMDPKLPVLVVSMHSEAQYGKRVLKAGASGFMNKESAPEELVRAIHKVLAGGRYVSAALAEKLAISLREDADRTPHESLSDREFEVLRMIAAGRTVSQIADHLHLGVTTVSTYRARILEKMHMTTTAELMRYALASGLVD
jgi:two-component system, NarL family, invasion response regulator UvrY